MLRQLTKKIIPKKMLNFRHLFWAWYGAIKYEHHSEKLMVIGVTGTSGKSSLIHFLRQMLESQGYKVGSLSTVDFYIGGEEKLNDQKMTMLGRMQIQKYLRQMVDVGCDIAIVETTSEGFLQYRHRFINYDTIILTNLYPEHIESHGSFANYKSAKLGIFEYIVSQKSKIKNKKSFDKVAIVNGNCKYAQEFLQFDFDNKIIFANSDKNIYAKKETITKEQVFVSDISFDHSGLHFKIDNREFINKNIYAEYNAMNILGGIAVLRNLDIAWSKIAEAVEKLKPAPGRLEFIPKAKKNNFRVFVDYAFEPVALQSLYSLVEKLKVNKVIHVCGSTGGGRDVARRPKIGKIVGEKADIIIVTNEDPYDEDPEQIIRQVSEGAIQAGKKKDINLFEIVDRRDAIKKALELAREGYLVIVTGKGSEQAICVKDNKMIPWDDREVIRELLK